MEHRKIITIKLSEWLTEIKIRDLFSKELSEKKDYLVSFNPIVKMKGGFFSTCTIWIKYEEEKELLNKVMYLTQVLLNADYQAHHGAYIHETYIVDVKDF